MKLFSRKEENEQQSQQEQQTKPRKKMGCLGKTIIGIAVYFGICFLFGLMMGDMMSTPKTELEENTIYRIDLKGKLVEQAGEENPFDALFA